MLSPSLTPAYTVCVCRTELHFNHFAENSAFGILPKSKASPLHFIYKKTKTTFTYPYMLFFLQTEEKQKATQQFAKLQAAMKVLSISAEEQKTFWLVLGAIYHLGAAGATKGIGWAS